MQEYLRSSKIMIGFLITVILITISTIINIDDYKQHNKVIGTSHWSFSTNIELKGKSIYIGLSEPVESNGDKSDFPRFEERRLSIVRNLKHALLDLAGLILWNQVLAVLAFVVCLFSVTFADSI